MSQDKPYIARDGNTHQFLPDLTPKPRKRRPRVYLFYTKSASLGWVPELIGVHTEASAIKRLGEIAERYGDDAPVIDADGKARYGNRRNGQIWWMERHEVV
jgi:hypothetical protein